VSDAGDQLVITSFQAAHRAAAGAKYLPYAHRSSRPHYKHVGFVLVDRHRLIADPSPDAFGANLGVRRMISKRRSSQRPPELRTMVNTCPDQFVLWAVVEPGAL